MSAYYNDYIIASNNSINDNKYNAQKLAKSPSYRLKKILKPILRILRQKNNKNASQSSSSNSNRSSNSKANYSMESYTHEEYQQDFWSSEIDDNFANEELESRILNEIEQCNNDAAIYVYSDDECEMQAVHQDQKFVPVHFARTEAGTFFWTTMQKPVDLEESSHCCSGYNSSHCGDRWVQA